MTKCTNPQCGMYASKKHVCPHCGAPMKMPEERLMRDPSFWNGNAPKGRYPERKTKEAD